MAKVYVESYGCSANKAHEETMLGLLKKGGHEISSYKECDVVILNTCVVKAATERKMRKRIARLSEKNLIIAGCMPKAEEKTLRLIAPNASLLGPFSSSSILKAVESVTRGGRYELLDRKAEYVEEKLRANPFVNVCEISHGCVDSCTYCITKLAKGFVKSFPPGKIVDDVRRSLGDGCKEVWLTSQDNACYGQDIGSSLPGLLDSIVSLEGDFRVRVGMMTPSGALALVDPLICAYRNEKVYKFLHIPVQAGSDRVLREMKRMYTKEEFIGLVREFRRKVEGLNLWTDIIVGFPWETEEDFSETLELLKAVRPDYVNVSRYSAMPGTLASRMVQLGSGALRDRSRIASRLVDALSFERSQEWVGRRCRILVTERGNREGQVVGRNEAYRPVVIEGDEELMGRFVDVGITRAGVSHLAGDIIS